MELSLERPFFPLTQQHVFIPTPGEREQCSFQHLQWKWTLMNACCSPASSQPHHRQAHITIVHELNSTSNFPMLLKPCIKPLESLVCKPFKRPQKAPFSASVWCRPAATDPHCRKLLRPLSVCRLYSVFSKQFGLVNGGLNIRQSDTGKDLYSLLSLVAKVTLDLSNVVFLSCMPGI